MLKKIIISGLIIFGVFLFYKKFMASTMEPFFKKHAGKTDFLQLKVQDYQIENK